MGNGGLPATASTARMAVEGGRRQGPRGSVNVAGGGGQEWPIGEWVRSGATADEWG